MAAIGGDVKFKIDGVQVLLRGNVTTNIGQAVVRESVRGLDGDHGYLERGVTPFVQIDMTETADFDLARVNAVVDSVVIAELKDGRTLMLRGARHVGEVEHNPEDATLPSVRCEGKTGEPIAGGAS